MFRQGFFKSASVVAAIVLFVCSLASAMTAPPPKYDKSSEVKIKGVISEVKTEADATVRLVITSDKGTLEIYVAPEKFLHEMEITFAKGDTVEVLGSKVTVDGNSLMLAREVTRAGDVMVMRDEAGKPVWVGWIK